MQPLYQSLVKQWMGTNSIIYNILPNQGYQSAEWRDESVKKFGR